METARLAELVQVSKNTLKAYLDTIPNLKIKAEGNEDHTKIVSDYEKLLLEYESLVNTWLGDVQNVTAKEAVVNYVADNAAELRRLQGEIAKFP